MPTTDDRLKTIELAALKQNGELPENMSRSETMFFEEMSCLYLRYNLGKICEQLPEDMRKLCPVITKDSASIQKKKYITGVKTMQMWEDIFHSELHVTNEVHKLVAPESELKNMDKEQLLDRIVRIMGVLTGLMNADDKIPPFLAGVKGEK